MTAAILVNCVRGQRGQQQQSSQILRSPCPDVLTVNPTNRTSDMWYGLLHLSTSNTILYGVYIDLIFDRTVLRVKTTFDDATTTDNYKFRIDQRSMTLEPGDRIDLGFHVRYVPNFGVPLIGQIRLNGQNICSVESRAFAEDDQNIRSPSTTGRENTNRFGHVFMFRKSFRLTFFSLIFKGVRLTTSNAHSNLTNPPAERQRTPRRFVYRRGFLPTSPQDQRGPHREPPPNG